ncbi:SseB family protein [Actinomadura harenae]|uniref:SseB protein N-terminal domain-containing protein n=1 Tax=Actinomadura harenae TaxID=2483351 RepID=A0A3M2LK91_9ACTN|nr:SseB family protein [Actinomadura harenae]RMI37220.1 hypothetical protein EBO15_36460 [Actinomadura harenae]
MATVADGWQPTSELERRLGDAVRSGDQEGYFRLLAESELVVPVPPDMVDAILANERQPTWPTQDEDDRTFVLVYTSPTAMRACLGPSYRHYVRVRFTVLAETWPDNNWWLAVDVPSHAVRNVSLPIEGRLPSWFLLQLAQGDARPPLAGHHQPDPSAPPGEAPVQDGAHPGPGGPFGEPGHAAPENTVPAPSASEGDVSVAGRSTGGPQQASRPRLDDPRATLPDLSVYTGRDTSGPAGDEGEPPLPPGMADMPPVPEPPRPAQASPASPASPAVAPVVSPLEASPAATSVDPIPVITPRRDADEPWEELQGRHRDLPRTEPRPEFQPANDVERSLLRAASDNDHDLFLQTLADAEVLVPVGPDTDFTLRPGRAAFQWRTRETDGVTFVQVFTSPERLADSAGTGADSIRVAFPLILRYWPAHASALAVNPGSPAGGTILAEQLSGLATWADQRAARRMSEEFEAQNEVEQRLFDAAVRRDTDAFFKVLLGAQVLVPAEPETPWGITPDDPEFPWRPTRVHGRVAIQLFTSLRWMNEAVGSSRFVMPTFLEVVAAWPDTDWTLVLNPGTPVDAAIPGEQVRALSGPAEPSPAPSAPAELPAGPASAEPSAQVNPNGRADALDLAHANGHLPPPEAAPSTAAAPADAGTDANAEAETPASADASAYSNAAGLPDAPEQADASPGTAPSGYPDAPANPDAAWAPGTGTPGNADTTEHTDTTEGTPTVGPTPLAGNANGTGHADVVVDATPADPAGVDAAEPSSAAGYAQANGHGDTPGQADAAGYAEADGRTDAGAAALAEANGHGDIAGPTEANGHVGAAGQADVVGGGDAEAAAEPEGVPAPEAMFEPGNRIDQELYEAALGGDSDAFLRVLLAANVLVPIPQDAPLQVTPTQQEFRWEAALRGSSAVQVFTSLVRLREVLPESRFVYADFRALIAAWPREDWAMLLNPGTRIGASLRGDQVRALSEWAIRVGLVQPVPEAEPDASALTPFAHTPGARQTANAAGTPSGASGEHAVNAGAGVQGVPHAGMPGAAPVGHVPDAPRSPHGEAPGVPDASSTRFGEDARGGVGADTGVGAPTQDAGPAPAAAPGPEAQGAPDAPSSAFETDAHGSITANAPSGVVAPPQGAPHAGPSDAPPSAVQADAHGSIGADAPGPVGALPQAAPQAGLPDTPSNGFGTDAHSANAPGPVGAPPQAAPQAGPSDAPSNGIAANAPSGVVAPAQGAPHTGPSDAASSAVQASAPGGPGAGVPGMPGGARAGRPGEVGAFAGVTAFGAAGERRRVVEDGDLGSEPTIMQKVVPHAHVAWYLEQGYDRVGGFVHQTADVAELQTPGQLYETLGLLYADAPFSVADESVHVIRWPAYCPDLYRVPFGGRTDEEVASWGEAGLVLERPPFTGAGFAPGSAGSIREYKVDSVRLPFGAEMYVLGRDGSERFVAMYDPDRLAWLRPEGATPAGRTEVAR